MTQEQKSWQLPVLTLAVTVFLFMAFHVQQVVKERGTLQQARAAQEQPLAQGQDVRQRLDRLAVETLKLAESGNSNAKALVERMKELGITINAPPASPAPQR